MNAETTCCLRFLSLPKDSYRSLSDLEIVVLVSAEIDRRLPQSPDCGETRQHPVDGISSTTILSRFDLDIRTAAVSCACEFYLTVFGPLT